MSEDAKGGKPSRLMWFVNGIIFSILVAGAAAYFVPFIQVPATPDGDAFPDRGDVVSEEGEEPPMKSLTIVEYRQEKPIKVKVEPPKVKIPDLKKDDEEPPAGGEEKRSVSSAQQPSVDMEALKRKLGRTESTESRLSAMQTILENKGQLTAEQRKKLALWVSPYINDWRMTERTVSICVLGELGVAKYAKDLADIMTGQKWDSTTYGCLVLSLGKLRAKEHARLVAVLLRDPNHELRRLAIQSLARMGATEYAPEIEKMKEHPVPKVRDEVALALAVLRAKTWRSDTWGVEVTLPAYFRLTFKDKKKDESVIASLSFGEDESAGSGCISVDRSQDFRAFTAGGAKDKKEDNVILRELEKSAATIEYRLTEEGAGPGTVAYGRFVEAPDGVLMLHLFMSEKAYGKYGWSIREYGRTLRVLESTAAGKKGAAAVIVRRMCDTYASLDSYRDRVVLESTTVQRDETRHRKSSFSTAFVRPNRLCFDVQWKTKDGEDARHVTWRDGETIREWSTYRGTKELPVRRWMGVSFIATAHSHFGLGKLVPSMLAGDEKWMGSFHLARRFGDLELRTDGDFDGRSCHRIVASKKDWWGPESLGLRTEAETTFWIEKETLLLRRVDCSEKCYPETTEAKDKRAHIAYTSKWTATYDVTVGKEIPDEALEYRSSIRQHGKTLESLESTADASEPGASRKTKTWRNSDWGLQVTLPEHFRVAFRDKTKTSPAAASVRFGKGENRGSGIIHRRRSENVDTYVVELVNARKNDSLILREVNDNGATLEFRKPPAAGDESATVVYYRIVKDSEGLLVLVLYAPEGTYQEHSGSIRQYGKTLQSLESTADAGEAGVSRKTKTWTSAEWGVEVTLPEHFRVSFKDREEDSILVARVHFGDGENAGSGWVHFGRFQDLKTCVAWAVRAKKGKRVIGQEQGGTAATVEYRQPSATGDGIVMAFYRRFAKGPEGVFELTLYAPEQVYAKHRESIRKYGKTLRAKE